MKKTIIIILVLIVIGVAFYFGYTRSQNKKGIELRTATNQPIHLEYKPALSGNPGFSISGFGPTLNIKGTLTLESLISNLFLNDKITGWNSYYLEVNPAVGNRLYQINLSIPKNEPALNIIESLGNKMEFSTFVGETTLQFYRAVRNDKPISFSVSQSSLQWDTDYRMLDINLLVSRSIDFLCNINSMVFSLKMRLG